MSKRGRDGDGDDWGNSDADDWRWKKRRVSLTINSGEVIDITAATQNQAPALAVSESGGLTPVARPSVFGAPKIDAGLQFGIAPPIDKYIAELDKMVELGKVDGDPKTEKRANRAAFLRACQEDDSLRNCFRTMCAFINGASRKQVILPPPAPLGQAIGDNNAAVPWTERDWETYKSPILILVSGGNVITLFAVLIERAFRRLESMRGNPSVVDGKIAWTPGTFVLGSTVARWYGNDKLKSVLGPIASSYFSDFDYSLVPNKKDIIQAFIQLGRSEARMSREPLRSHMSQAVIDRGSRRLAYEAHRPLMDRVTFPGPDPVHIGRGKQAGGFTLMRAKTAFLPTKGEEIRLLSIPGTVPDNIYRLFPQVAKPSQYELLDETAGGVDPSKVPAGLASLTNLLMQRKSIEIETRLNVYMTLDWLKTALVGRIVHQSDRESEKLARLVMGEEGVYDPDERAAQADTLMVYLNGVSNTMNAAIALYPGRANNWNEICYRLSQPAASSGMEPWMMFVRNTFGGLSELVSSQGRTLLSNLSSRALRTFLVHDAMIMPRVPMSAANPGAPTRFGLNDLMDYMTAARIRVNAVLARLEKATVRNVLMIKDIGAKLKNAPSVLTESVEVGSQRFQLYTAEDLAAVFAVPGRPDRDAAQEIRVQNRTELPIPNGIRVTINTIVTDDLDGPPLVPPPAAEGSPMGLSGGKRRRSQRRRGRGKKRRPARTRRPIRARRRRRRRTRIKRRKQHSLRYKKTCRR